jgi:hypothetical protein
VSNEDRARAFNERHPDRRKVLNRIGFAFHLEPKQEDNLIEKRISFAPILSTRKPTVQIKENDQDEKSPE